MKKGIHPEMHKVKFVCSCWQVFEVYSTINKDIVRIEICSNCHPFYTWEEKIVKTGAVDKFYARLQKTEQLKNKNKASK